MWRGYCQRGGGQGASKLVGQSEERAVTPGLDSGGGLVCLCCAISCRQHDEGLGFSSWSVHSLGVHAHLTCVAGTVGQNLFQGRRAASMVRAAAAEPPRDCGSDEDGSPTQWVYKRVGRKQAPATPPSPELVALVVRHAPGEGSGLLLPHMFSPAPAIGCLRDTPVGC